MNFFIKCKSQLLFRLVNCLTIFSFSLSLILLPVSQSNAQSVLNLPKPGAMVSLSPSFMPVTIKGIKIFPQNPLRFDFIIDPGESNLENEALKKESTKLIKYFLASLTVPEDDLWVNLSPYEKDRIIPDDFGQTEMGRDLLAQDYILKQITASLIYPEEGLGKRFWDKVYKKAGDLYGTSEIPVNTFNKVWIIPEKAVVYESGETVFVAESHLKVMLEEDYVSLEHNSFNQEIRTDQIVKRDVEQPGDVSSSIIRKIIIPELEKEVNTGENFANLRQIYNSVILATWFKQNLKESFLGKVYMDQNKVGGVNTEDRQVNKKIYQQYLEAYKIGVYDFIKEDYDTATQEIIPRKYFSGGAQLALGETLRSLEGPGTDQVDSDDFFAQVVLAPHSHVNRDIREMNDGLPKALREDKTKILSYRGRMSKAILKKVQELLKTRWEVEVSEEFLNSIPIVPYDGMMSRLARFGHRAFGRAYRGIYDGQLFYIDSHYFNDDYVDPEVLAVEFLKIATDEEILEKLNEAGGVTAEFQSELRDFHRSMEGDLEPVDQDEVMEILAFAPGDKMQPWMLRWWSRVYFNKADPTIGRSAFEIENILRRADSFLQKQTEAALREGRLTMRTIAKVAGLKPARLDQTDPSLPAAPTSTSAYRVITREDSYFKSPTFQQSLVMADGIVRTRFYTPSPEELQRRQKSLWQGSTVADNVIIGGGPIGISLGIHSVGAGFKTVIFERGRIAQTVSDPYMRLSWQRTPPFGISLVQKGVSSQRLLDAFHLANEAVLNPYRVQGEKARRIISDVTGERFLGLPPGADQLNNTNVPVARNEFYSHILDVAQGIIDRGGFVVEAEREKRNAVTSIEKLSSGLFRVETEQGHVQLTHRVTFANGQVGEDSKSERVADILQKLTESDPGKYLPLFNLSAVRDPKFVEEGIKSRQPVMISGPLADQKHVRPFIRGLSDGTHAVIGSGQTAVEAARDILSMSPTSAKVHLFMKKYEIGPSQMPADYKNHVLLSRSLFDQELRGRTLKYFLEEYGTPVTPPTAKVIEDAINEGRLVIHEIGDYFDERNFSIHTVERGGRVVSEIAIEPSLDRAKYHQKRVPQGNIVTDNEDGRKVVAEISGVIVSAIGYDYTKNRKDPLIQEMVRSGIVELDEFGKIRLDPENGITSKTDLNVYVTGASNLHQGTPADTAIAGGVFRNGEIVKDMLNVRKGSMSDDETIDEINRIAHQLGINENSTAEDALLVVDALQPGQNVERVQTWRTKDFFTYPTKDQSQLIFGSSQLSVDGPDKVKRLLNEHFLNVPDAPLRVSAAVMQGRNPVMINQWAEVDLKGYPPELLLAAAQPGKSPEWAKASFSGEDFKGYEETVRLQFILAKAAQSVVFDDNTIKEVYEKFRKKKYSPIVSAVLTRAFVAYFPQGELDHATMANTGDISSPLGGIDLNPNNFELQSTGAGVTFTLPIDIQDYDNIQINGFSPVIFQLVPITNFPSLLLGISDQEENTSNVSYNSKLDPLEFKNRFKIREPGQVSLLN